jgi:hypothetical protein
LRPAWRAATALSARPSAGRQGTTLPAAGGAKIRSTSVEVRADGRIVGEHEVDDLPELRQLRCAMPCRSDEGLADVRRNKVWPDEVDQALHAPTGGGRPPRNRPSNLVCAAADHTVGRWLRSERSQGRRVRGLAKVGSPGQKLGTGSEKLGIGWRSSCWSSAGILSPLSLTP